MSVVRMFHAAFFYLSSVYRKRSKEYRVSYFFYPSPVSPKGGEAVCLLAEKLIDKVLLYFYKTFS